MSLRPSTKVFICYKKRLEKEEVGIRVFQQNTYAETIAEILNTSEDGFAAWLDEGDLPGGIEWEHTNRWVDRPLPVSFPGIEREGSDPRGRCAICGARLSKQLSMFKVRGNLLGATGEPTAMAGRHSTLTF
jgi:hypothetical protein